MSKNPDPSEPVDSNVPLRVGLAVGALMSLHRQPNPTAEEWRVAIEDARQYLARALDELMPK